MLGMPSRRLCLLAAALASLGSSPGCSGGDAPPIDVATAVVKASGGESKARLPAKVKAADDAAAKLHPKLR